MSYYITISGHKDTESEEASKTFAEDVAEKAKEFVASLEGVTSAQISGTGLDTPMSLMPPQNQVSP